MGIFMNFLKKGYKIKTEERVQARCRVTQEPYDIHLGHENGKLTMLRGERSYTDNTSISTGSGAKTGY